MAASMVRRCEVDRSNETNGVDRFVADVRCFDFCLTGGSAWPFQHVLKLAMVCRSLGP